MKLLGRTLVILGLLWSATAAILKEQKILTELWIALIGVGLSFIGTVIEWIQKESDAQKQLNENLKNSAPLAAEFEKVRNPIPELSVILYFRVDLTKAIHSELATDIYKSVRKETDYEFGHGEIQTAFLDTMHLTYFSVHAYKQGNENLDDEREANVSMFLRSSRPEQADDASKWFSITAKCMLPDLLFSWQYLTRVYQQSLDFTSMTDFFHPS